ncbi:MAG: hypothetical protein ABL880_08355 [Methylotenera sp.]
MSWKTAWYGPEYPTTSKKVVTNGLMLLLFFAIYSFYSDFIPSKTWASLGLKISIAVATITLAASYWAMWAGKIKPPPNNFSKLKMTLIRIVVVPLMFLSMYWLSVVYGVGNLYTLTIGTPHQEVTELQKYQRASRRGCDFYVRGGDLADNALKREFCISEESYQQLPNEPFHALVDSEKSYFGTRVLDFRNIEEQKPL